MVLEIVGSRVISPYFGNSLVVWTSLIGVILGCLSAGYYWGGKLADKKATYEILESVIFGSTGFLAGTAFLKDALLNTIQFSFGGDLRASTFVAVLLLYGPTSLLLGMVSPIAAKLKLIDLHSSGRVVGNLYALSTFGSIVGTFLAGFYLVPSFGNSLMLYFLTLSLLFLSILTIWRIKVKHIFLLIILCILYFLNHRVGLFTLPALTDVDSLYNRILIRKISDQRDGDVIAMSIDNKGVQSAVALNNPDRLYLDYDLAFHNLGLDAISPKKVLVIGGGGYIIPRDILKNQPTAEVDVVEIDPEITRLAREYFFLEDDTRLKIFHQDARAYLRKTTETYDVIFLDAFNSISPPAHLTTKEFMQDLKNHLNEDGYLVVNMVSALSGPDSEFLSAEIATLGAVFSNTRIYRVQKLPVGSVQNLLAVASRRKILLSGVVAKPPEPGKILTDDWSPVEFMTRNFY